MPDVAANHASFPRSSAIRQSVPLVTASLWLMLFAATLIFSVTLCDGRLIFTLDDPYIHLAVADHIRSGGYGVNASEVSSPSSSIIWPYLLAVTETLHLGAFGPLLINAAAAAATVVAFLRILESAELLGPGREKPLLFFVALLAIFSSSAIALPMTGMEHSLHVWATVATFGGLTEAARGRSPTAMHFAALVLLPLIRFEGIAFAIAAMIGFALLGQRRFAAAAAAVMLCAFAAYFARMVALGLPLLPSSVLLKSRIAESGYEGTGVFASILRNLGDGFANPAGFRLMLLGLALAGVMALLRSDRGALIVCATVLAAIAAHLGFGQYGWFYRYEVYIVALAVLALLYAVARARAVLSVPQWTAATLATVGLASFASVGYASAALETPFASRGVYEQHYQLGRFAQQLYRRPIAVNDLGLVAWGNPNFVLDLWGLGSERVRKAKRAGRYGPAEMAALADEYHVGVAMIYDSWFAQGVPASWRKVAILHTIPVTGARGDVSFYVTPAAEPQLVAGALKAFASTLPARDRLEMVAP
ncbi:hypothetical protein [Bradyrhizobium sp. BRP56]|uniref:hypothetical protein n=1 Tax=Bradyrhizobium sp. BRP56 TaxID=2793819 RepID=UPI001CD3403D|nr:hypothetical protein [Bradyrhizobium sp. BRP56]MCA1402029.1 hypothetical protein [Bradyrhizobium sp. BRP56]